METDERVELKVTVERGSGDYWNVHVDGAAGDAFAMSSARGLDLALRGALPYMAAAVEELSGPLAKALADAEARAVQREHDELAEAGRTIAEEYERQHGVRPRLRCPDRASCVRGCGEETRMECWRVRHVPPLPGTFEGNRWPDGALPTIVTGENP